MRMCQQEENQTIEASFTERCPGALEINFEDLHE